MTLTVLPAGVRRKKAAGPAAIIKNSIRLRRSATGHLYWDCTKAGVSTTKWTYSEFLKRGELGSNQYILYAFSYGPGGTPNRQHGVFFTPDNKISFKLELNAKRYMDLTSTEVFRDPAAFMHLVVVWDTAQAVEADRVKIYANNKRLKMVVTGALGPGDTAFPPLNQAGLIGEANMPISIGAFASLPNYPAYQPYAFDGERSSCILVDGQALAPSDFGTVDATTGGWVPIDYAGTYGNIGFYLDFKDNSTITALGKDSSGNNNNFTPTNVSLSGVTNDSMTDVAIPASESTGNYVTFNPLNNTTALSNANLNALGTASAIKYSAGTFAVSSGKYYFEYIPSAIFSGAGVSISFGLAKSKVSVSNVTRDDVYFYNNNGSKYGGGSAEVPYAASYAVNDVIGVALDMDAGTVSFYKNNVSQGVAFSNLKGQSIMPFISTYDVASCSINCGQQPFRHAPPTGFLPLNTYNLPTPAIAKPSDHFDVVLDTGANIKAKAEALYAGSQFLMWIKDRQNANNHQLIDSVRGLNLALRSNTQDPEAAYVAPTGNSVAWVWKAGGAPVANNDGSIASMISANKTDGFSIVTWTGTGANGTVGHGLSSTPSFNVVRSKNGAVWAVYHQGLNNPTQGLYLNTTNAAFNAPTYWNSTSPTSNLFSLGTDNATNSAGVPFVAYCWTSIEGYSAFGNYTGNGNADGTFVYLGFKPRWVMTKPSSATGNWTIFDSVRDPYNVSEKLLYAHLPQREENDVSQKIDFLSNGFKIRGSNPNENASGGHYIYAAFAEHPFKHSLAR
jgi:SPRY domain